MKSAGRFAKLGMIFALNTGTLLLAQNTSPQPNATTHLPDGITSASTPPERMMDRWKTISVKGNTLVRLNPDVNFHAFDHVDIQPSHYEASNPKIYTSSESELTGLLDKGLQKQAEKTSIPLKASGPSLVVKPEIVAVKRANPYVNTTSATIGLAVAGPLGFVVASDPSKGNAAVEAWLYDSRTGQPVAYIESRTGTRFGDFGRNFAHLGVARKDVGQRSPQRISMAIKTLLGMQAPADFASSVGFAVKTTDVAMGAM